MAQLSDKCVFCSIVQERSSEIFYEDDEFISFKDIRPATSQHYLVIPKNHVGNPKTLKPSDVDLVKKLLSIGKQILNNNENARYGFHWPPFNRIEHLHMHAIAPVSEMSFFSRLIFKPDSFQFITASTFIQKLETTKEML